MNLQNLLRYAFRDQLANFQIFGDPFAIFEKIIFFMKELYQLGARRIGVFSLSPLGCVPLQRTVKGGIERDCVEIINEGALIFNSKLSSSLVDLAKKLEDSRLVYLENYIELHDIIINHNQYGKYYLHKIKTH